MRKRYLRLSTLSLLTKLDSCKTRFVFSVLLMHFSTANILVLVSESHYVSILQWFWCCIYVVYAFLFNTISFYLLKNNSTERILLVVSRTHFAYSYGHNDVMCMVGRIEDR